MKRSLSLFSILAFILTFSGSAFGQNTSVNIQATAEVLTNIQASVQNPVDFGNVDPELNPAPTLDVPNLSASNISGTSQFGTIQLIGASGNSVAVTFPSNPVTLSDGAASPSTMNYNVQLGYTNEDVGNQTAGNTQEISTSGDTITLADGEGTIILGGTLDNPSPATGGSLPSGTYSGSVEVSFDYTF